MRTSHSAALVAAAAVMASVAALGSGPAAADAPPTTWDPDRNRTLTCDDTGTVEGQWARGGVFTAFLIQDSTDVIVAKKAIVTFPDGTVYTQYLAPGFDVNKAEAHCTYTDPAGLYIELWGLRS